MTRKTAVIAAVALTVPLVFISDTILATHYQENIRSGTDIMMKDLRWPVFDQGTYYCVWSARFVPKGVAKHSFYGGVAVKGPKRQPGMFWTYWGDIKTVASGRQFYAGGYGGEGSSGGFSGAPTFMRPNDWYRFVMRIFPSKDKERAKKNAYVGWWVKDIEKDTWHFHSVVELPAPVTGFAGNGGFVEALAPESVKRAFERRLGYGRVNGEWYKADTISCKGPNEVRIVSDGTVMRYDRPAIQREGEGQRVGKFVTKQPDRPPFDAIVVRDAAAKGMAGQVSVEWTVPANSSPQLAYRIEVFARAGGMGEPVFTAEENAPFINARRFDVPGRTRSVRLTITDIFDQTKSIILPIKSPRTPKRVRAPRRSSIRPGLLFKYYEAPGKETWTELPDLSRMEPMKAGLVTAIDDTIREARVKDYAIRYLGYFKAPADGIYVVSAGTCDGSRIKVDGETLVEDTGVHSNTVRQYTVALTEGLHSLDIDYFRGNFKTYSPNRIILEWEGPGFARRALGGEDLMCADSGGIPSFDIAVKSPVVDGVLHDSYAEIHAKADLRGHKLTAIQLFSGRTQLAAAKEVDRSGHAVFRLLLPKGKNRIWSRLWYDGRNSVNAGSEITVDARNLIEGPWTFTVISPDLYPVGARSKDGTTTFIGEGYYFAHQKVTGDFTLTGRVSDIALATKDSGVHPVSWIGLMTKDVTKQSPDVPVRPYQTTDFTVFITAGRGVRAKADWRDLGGGRMSRFEVGPKDHRWLRIIKRGDRYMSYTSADGREWRKSMERIADVYRGEQFVGMCFRTVPGKARRLFQASMDSVTLETDTPAEPARAKPSAAELKLKGRITAVVQSPARTDTLYARSPGKGVLVSTDRGDTWREANRGATSREALAVRSVAAHHKDPKVVLRGGGYVAGGRLKSGLWKSSNGGNSWRLVSKEIDFDGTGPTALFGEVISFSRTKPDLVAAAGEMSGVYISRDAGDTWTYADLKGERVTALRFCRDPRKDDILMVGTFAESEFGALGLGKPNVRGGEKGCVHLLDVSDTHVRKKAFLRADDFGVTNVGFGVDSGFLSLATTRGVYDRWPHGLEFSQKRQYQPSDAFVVALGHRRFMKEIRPTDIRVKMTCYSAPFSSEGSNAIYRVIERLSMGWRKVNNGSRLVGAPRGAYLGRGLTCILPDNDEPKTVFLCNVDGIYKSTDECRTFRLVRAGR
jgi:hypothetical protein